ncbi:rotatin [Sitophilus oryzae]|uniref:Rotatin n=1 Tax=Sitophilus oryzae TaxID=7048 RepID=A0A6J2XFA0_SITOR|nr:rotatin [Sitophilus oryzae]
MHEKCVTANQIKKLGHKIQEIRDRALISIISKLENGYTFDNDLARSRELLTNLLNWFLFEPCSNEEHVLNLIESIFQSDAGQLLITHCGKRSIQEDLKKIQTYINPQYIPKLKEIQDLLKNNEKQSKPIVPPLNTDIPLSYRSEPESFTSIVGTTATTIEGLIQKGSSVAQQIGFPPEFSTYRIENGSNNTPVSEHTKIYMDLTWHSLIETDNNVLQSVGNSLKNIHEITKIYQSCEFFINVLLHDFPAEIFIQRPEIILIFYELLQLCRSTRITNITLLCLYNVTTSLQRRIYYYNDVSIKNLKTEIFPNLTLSTNGNSSNRSSVKSDKSTDSSEIFEGPEYTAALQNKQYSIPYFCFQTLNTTLKCLILKKENYKEPRLNLNQTGVNTALALLNKLVDLLCQAVYCDKLWTDQPNPEALAIIKELNNTLSIYGDVLEFFRVESISLEANFSYKVIYLYLLCICAKWLKTFVPLSKSKITLPKNFKTSITNSLLDVSLGRLFPKVHKCLLEFVESFSTTENQGDLEKYKKVTVICNGLAATVKFLNNADNLPLSECISLAEEALPSIQFHKSEKYLKRFIDFCSEKLYAYSNNYELVKLAQDVIAKLLAHCDFIVQKLVYKLCCQKIIDNIGTKINLISTVEVGAQAYFLFSSKILTEMAVFGLNNDNISEYAKDILLYILKCKIIVSENVWYKCLEALIPSLPLILCYAETQSTFGQVILNLVDPDTAKNMSFPNIVMLRSNVQLLYAKDAYLRNEAFSRLCWLIACQENSRELLPKFNTIYDKGFANVCQIKKILDINKIRKSEHFYQPSSLSQVLDLLKSPNVEPVIRRSALNQVSVMVEDHLLHDIFLEFNGTDLIIEIMENCLKEKDFKDYPDSIIPVISILKSIALFNSNVRYILSTNINVLFYTLRGVFLFFTDDRVRQDASTLLFILIFNDYIIGTPSRGNFSIPVIFEEKLFVPFNCNVHMRTSQNTEESLYSVITDDKWSFTTIQVQWNAEINGGFKNLIELSESDLLNQLSVTEDILKLNISDLVQIKSSLIQPCIKKYLDSIQSATSHNDIIDSISSVILYINFYNNVSKFNNNSNHDQILSHPWEKTFIRFLEVLPSSDEDIELLKSVIKFLALLLPFYKDQSSCWISDIVKNPNNCLLNLITYENVTNEEIKILSQDLLHLITLCVVREQHYLDHYNSSSCKTRKNCSNWNGLIKIISENLLLNNAQHFYNLAYLNALLSCLVHLTASLGWTSSTPGSTIKPPLPQMISSLCELLTAFHCGKGPTATISVMGLSISRNVLLILNHILSEIHSSKIKRWEKCFFGDIVDINFIRSILALWSSRDVVLRAAAVQLFSNLSASPKAAEDILNDLKYDNAYIWTLAFTVLIDHTEAPVVRENAAFLLTNLTKNIFEISDSKAPVLLIVSSSNLQRESSGEEILSLFDENDFYSHLEIILTSLFTLNYDCEKYPQQIKSSSSEKSSSSSNTADCQINITTPGFVNAVYIFLYNAVELAPKEISSSLHEKGLIKLIFRTICNPLMTVETTRKLALYCNILEMNQSVCSLLRKICSLNPSCIGTILYTRDCLFVMFGLLNTNIYQTNLPELLYLRNKLWSEIFNLCVELLETLNEENTHISSKSIEGLNLILETLSSVGIEQFLDSLCESLSSLGSIELQHSALKCLASMLRLESYNSHGNLHKITRDYSLEVLLDTVNTPRSVYMSSIRENLENLEPKEKPASLTKTGLKNVIKYKNNLLEEAYFEKIIQNTNTNVEDVEVSFVDNTSNTSIAGSELCKILLYLYDIASVKVERGQHTMAKKSIIISALTSLLYISNEAKAFALKKGLMEVAVKELRDHHIKLSLESVESLRKIQDKKRICPILDNVHDWFGLLTNFMLNDQKVKLTAVDCNLADIIHKLWIWFMIQNTYIVDALQLIFVYTSDCMEACHSLPLTSAVAGSGPRKTPSNVSLLHAVIAVVVKEMGQISRSHNLCSLELAFEILQNCSDLLECRVLIAKSNIFQAAIKLHPSVTRRQYPWDSVEQFWLNFLHIYTKYPEGQAAVAKANDVLELIISLTSGTKIANRETALLVLRNLAFYQPNRPRLLSSGDFINVLQVKLTHGTVEEKKTVILIMWSMAANNQKAKLIFNASKLDVKLENILKHMELLEDSDSSLEVESLSMIHTVLGIIRGSDKNR